MKDRDFTKKLSKNPEKKVHNSRSYKIFGKYQSEGEEGEDRAHISQLLLLFYIVLTRSKTVIRDFHTVNLVVQYRE